MSVVEHQAWVEELAAQFEDHPEGPLEIINSDNSSIKYVITEVHWDRDKIVMHVAVW